MKRGARKEAGAVRAQLPLARDWRDDPRQQARSRKRSHQNRAHRIPRRAQQHDNAPYAGPGGGDLKFAARMGFACVVLTFVDERTLGADVYFPDGTVVDVGALRHAGVGR